MLQGRKALMALKGVVRLQAVIRGQNTRRLILTRLKSLQPIAKPQVHRIIIPQVDKDYITISNPQKILLNKDKKVPVSACHFYMYTCILFQSCCFYLIFYCRLAAQLVRTGRTA